MKYFLKKIIYFFIPIVIAIVVVSGVYYFKILKVGYKLKEIAQYKVLIMGDSQMQRLLPECIDEPTFNFASSGEHFYFTYHKLLQICKVENFKVEKVLLGISAHNFAPIYTALFDLNTPEGKKSLKSYLYFIPIIDSEFIKSNEILSKSMIQSIILGPDWGRVIRSKHLNPSDSLINISFNMHYKINSEHAESFKIQNLYIRKIYDLCKIHNIKLVYVSTPYHRGYKMKVEKRYFDMLANSVNQYKDIEYLNFLNSDIDSTQMADGNHLNFFGAKIITQRINNHLNKHLK